MFVFEIIILFTLNLHNAICQFYLSKVGKVKKKKPNKQPNMLKFFLMLEEEMIWEELAIFSTGPPLAQGYITS